MISLSFLVPYLFLFIYLKMFKIDRIHDNMKYSFSEYSFKYSKHPCKFWLPLLK